MPLSNTIHKMSFYSHESNCILFFLTDILPITKQSSNTEGYMMI